MINALLNSPKALFRAAHFFFVTKNSVSLFDVSYNRLTNNVILKAVCALLCTHWFVYVHSGNSLTIAFKC